MRLDWLELSYEASPIAVDDQLSITGVDGNMVLTGFSESPLLFDISDPDNPMILTGSADTEGATRIRLENSVHLNAVGPKGFLTISNLTARRQPTLTDPSNQADLIVIAPDSFAPALVPLIEHRQKSPDIFRPCISSARVQRELRQRASSK